MQTRLTINSMALTTLMSTIKVKTQITNSLLKLTRLIKCPCWLQFDTIYVIWCDVKINLSFFL